MKKNLRNILVLSLGLITTIASAQWSATSTTRISGEDANGNRDADQRIAVSADWGGIHASYDIAYRVAGTSPSHGMYEAYASTDLMGFGTLTIGRQDHSFGSGALISSNDWAIGPLDRLTTDGLSFGMDLAGFGVEAGTMDGINSDLNTYINASGEFAGANVNILMLSDGEAGTKAHGYDLSYGFSDFNVSASMNSDYGDDEMTSYGVSYSGIANMTVWASRTEYVEGSEIMGGGTAESTDPITGVVTAATPDTATGTYNGFGTSGTSSMEGGWANGSIGYLNAGDENTSMGFTYDLGDFSVSYTRHAISNERAGEAGDREANSFGLNWNMNDNCTVGISRFQDDKALVDNDKNWITLSITP